MNQPRNITEREPGTASEKPSGSTAGSFKQSGYVVLRSLVAQATRLFLYEYALKAAWNGVLLHGDDQIPRTPCRYADPFMEALLELMLPKIESISGLQLFPTYSYFRVYQQGDVLKRHQHRPACEVSVTLSLGYQAEKPWPIWFEVDGAARNAHLEPGDALLYEGIEVPHWRDPFDGEHAAQLFLHYAEQAL